MDDLQIGGVVMAALLALIAVLATPHGPMPRTPSLRFGCWLGAVCAVASLIVLATVIFSLSGAQPDVPVGP